MVSGNVRQAEFVHQVACLVSEAPHLGALCLQPAVHVCAADMPTLLQPLVHAECLHTLWLCVNVTAPDTHADVLGAVARYLTQPPGQGDSKARCPHLRCVGVGRWPDDWPAELLQLQQSPRV